MKRLFMIAAGLSLVLIALSATTPGGETVLAEEAGCMVGGGGKADGHRMTAEARSTDTGYTGSVKVTTATGDVFVSDDVVLLQCRRDGGGGPEAPDADVNIADFEGTGTLNGVSGFEYGVTLHDHGEGNLTDRLADDFAIAIVDSGGFPILVAAGTLDAGNVQILPPNDAHE
jgi:hypothetical protein